MTFDEIITKVSVSRKSRENILTDGIAGCSHADLPAILERIHRAFLKRAVTAEHCLAFECANTVMGALTLLYLLQKGFDFYLSHAPGGRAGNPETQPALPSFCKNLLTMRPVADSAPEMSEAVFEQNLCFQKNSGFKKENGSGNRTGGRMYIQTSGSMGASKIVVHSQEKLLGNMRNCVRRYKLTSGDRIAVPVPIFHLYGLGAAFLPAMSVGASIDLQHNANLLRYLDREKKFRPNVTFLTPGLCEMLLRGRKSSFPYKLAVTSGQRMKENIFRALDPVIGGKLVNQYGSTEMGALAVADSNAPLDVRAATIGRPMPGARFLLSEKASARGEGRGRELLCKYKYGFEGYVDDSGRWLFRLTPEDWFSTGDLAQKEGSGYYAILDRCDHSVNRDGFLVLLSDIERGMERLDKVRRAVVVTTKDEKDRGRLIAAFCQPTPGVTLDGGQVRKACLAVLPRYAVPDLVCMVDSIPTLPSGKIDRQALVQMAERIS